MGSFIARQPNGLLCRFSSVVDTVTRYNMTDEEYIVECVLRGMDDGKDVLERQVKPFNWVEESFIPNNMTQEEFDKIMEEMKTPVSELEQPKIDISNRIEVKFINPICKSIPVTIPNIYGLPANEIVYGNIYSGDKIIGYIDETDNNSIHGVIFDQADLYVCNAKFYISVEENKDEENK